MVIGCRSNGELEILLLHNFQLMGLHYTCAGSLTTESNLYARVGVKEEMIT